MKPDPNELACLLESVGRTFGRIPRTPSDFQALADSIHIKTGRTIGLSTLKRLWGYINDQTGTTYSTLSLLSVYVGYNDWDGFCIYAYGTRPDSDDDSDFSAGQLVLSSSLPLGSMVTVLWGDDKGCVLKKTAHPDTFTVESTTNIKLLPGDVTVIRSISVGHPLYATGCIRGSVVLGSYTGAHRSGIKTITLRYPAMTQ